MTGQALVAITREEADRLADAAFKVATEYDLAKYFQGKTPALVGLVIVAGGIYIPKVVLLVMLSRAMKQQRRPVSAAETANSATKANGATPPTQEKVDDTINTPRGQYNYKGI